MGPGGFFKMMIKKTNKQSKYRTLSYAMNAIGIIDNESTINDLLEMFAMWSTLMKIDIHLRNVRLIFEILGKSLVFSSQQERFSKHLINTLSFPCWLPVELGTDLIESRCNCTLWSGNKTVSQEFRTRIGKWIKNI